MMTPFDEIVRQAREKNDLARKAVSMKIFEVFDDYGSTAVVIANKKREALRLLRNNSNWPDKDGYTIRKIGKAVKTTTGRVVSTERIR